MDGERTERLLAVFDFARSPLAGIKGFGIRGVVFGGTRRFFSGGPSPWPNLSQPKAKRLHGRGRQRFDSCYCEMVRGL